MRIAVCYSGHLRQWQRIIEFHKKFLGDLRSKHEVDVFIHTWSTHEDENSQHVAVESKADFINLKGVPVNVYDVINVFNPVQLSISDKSKCRDLFQLSNVYPQHEINFDTFNAKYNVINGELISYSQLYGIYNSHSLKLVSEVTRGYRYDLVFRCRPDFRFNENVLDLINRPLDRIYVPKIYKARAGYEYAINDTFAFGPSNLMDVYGSCFGNYRLLIFFYDPEKFPYEDNDSNCFQFQIERVLYRWLKNCNVNIEPLNIEMIRA